MFPFISLPFLSWLWAVLLLVDFFVYFEILLLIYNLQLLLWEEKGFRKITLCSTNWVITGCNPSRSSFGIAFKASISSPTTLASYLLRKLFLKLPTSIFRSGTRQGGTGLSCCQNSNTAIYVWWFILTFKRWDVVYCFWFHQKRVKGNYGTTWKCIPIIFSEWTYRGASKVQVPLIAEGINITITDNATWATW